MVIRHVGHAEFEITLEEGIRIVTDPYDASCGYPVEQIEADVALVSHHHHDHDAVENLLYFVTKCCSYDVRRHKFSYFSTLLNNAKRIALGHYPEVIMAWLQTLDSYYHKKMDKRIEKEIR